MQSRSQGMGDVCAKVGREGGPRRRGLRRKRRQTRRRASWILAAATSPPLPSMSPLLAAATTCSLSRANSEMIRFSSLMKSVTAEGDAGGAPASVACGGASGLLWPWPRVAGARVGRRCGA